MRQRKVTKEEQEQAKENYPDLYKYRMTTFAGFAFDFVDKNTFDDNEEEREKFYQSLWDEGKYPISAFDFVAWNSPLTPPTGGFRYWLATYKDMLFDKKANDQAYNFWAKKTRARIQDPKKRDILAPLEAPHAWGTKRPSLEQDYYEQLDKPQNDIVNVKENPIVEVRENGIVTADGQLREFDIIALATGFDSVTGGMKNMGLRDIHGTLLKDKWAEGTYSYLGMVSHSFQALLQAVNGRVKLTTFVCPDL